MGLQTGYGITLKGINKIAPQFCLLLYKLSTPSETSRQKAAVKSLAAVQSGRDYFYSVYLRAGSDLFTSSCLKSAELNLNLLDLAKSHTSLWKPVVLSEVNATYLSPGFC